MSDMEFYESGFDDLSDLLKEFEISEEDAMGALEETAEMFVQDIRKLPKPRSAITASGYTHLLDTVTYRRNKSEIEVGWGKYYGPMVDRGTRKMRGTPHIKPTFQSNQDKYFRAIQKKLFG